MSSRIQRRAWKENWRRKSNQTETYAFEIALQFAVQKFAIENFARTN